MKVGHYATRARLATGMILGLGLVAADSAQAQGCVASRMESPTCPLRHKDDELTSYNLPKGRWESSFGYRFFRSHRHFVGAIEQNGGPKAERDRRSSEVINHVHIPTVSLTYGLSERWSLSSSLPVLIAHRTSPPSASRPFRAPTDARGISDLNLMARFWGLKPSAHLSQNFSLGFGVKLPTGNEGVQDDTWVTNPATRQLETIKRPVDQSIQPGDGGFGLLTEFQGFKAVGSATLFASGSYLFNPRKTNGVPTNRSRPSDAIMSVADQYAARVGVAYPARFLRGLSLSLGARLEGVPSEDVFGSSDGFRRPGYSVGIEPGVSYAWGHNGVSLSVPYLVRRVRTQNVGDKALSEATGTHVNGDAAFADYVVIVGFSRRF